MHHQGLLGLIKAFLRLNLCYRIAQDLWNDCEIRWNEWKMNEWIQEAGNPIKEI